MSTIDRTQGTFVPLQGKVDAGDAKPKTGSGTTNGTDGPAPNVAASALPGTASLASMFASPSLAPKRSGGSEMALAEVAVQSAIQFAKAMQDAEVERMAAITRSGA